jgi:hypothetical protein
MFGNDTAKNVTFTVDGGGDIEIQRTLILRIGVATATVVLDSSTDPIVIDFWTYNQGTTVYAEYRGRFEA